MSRDSPIVSESDQTNSVTLGNKELMMGRSEVKGNAKKKKSARNKTELKERKKKKDAKLETKSN